ncbi:unnamed protein product [Anisakis simplex]|uniref:Ovule protein n=1 Tax=Anisakis simplex TaxID=6269 RepID=A0A0M3K6P2_ANISI|nr:unnamed protein product [Anisakis simplex]
MAFEGLLDSLLQESDQLPEKSGKRSYEKKLTLAQRHSNSVSCYFGVFCVYKSEPYNCPYRDRSICLKTLCLTAVCLKTH